MKSKIVTSGVHRESARLFLAVLAIAAVAALPFPAAAARAVVTEAGADPTGRTDSTPAIQKCVVVRGNKVVLFIFALRVAIFAPKCGIMCESSRKGGFK